jgi:hypothetical protein
MRVLVQEMNQNEELLNREAGLKKTVACSKEGNP